MITIARTIARNATAASLVQTYGIPFQLAYNTLEAARDDKRVACMAIELVQRGMGAIDTYGIRSPVATAKSLARYKAGERA
jgi:hypothetical protein